MARPRYLDARQAAQELGVSLPTLYAYVSRGLIRSEAAEGRRRTRRYSGEDVRRLKERKEQRRNPERAGERALHWGTPVLESALTLIAEGKYYYRGRDALALAQTHSFEQVTTLLWTGELPAEGAGIMAADPSIDLRPYRGLLARAPGLAPVEVFQACLPFAAAADPAAYDLRPAAVRRTGARILSLLAALAAGQAPARAGEIAGALAQSWAPGHPQAAGVLNAALSLCADHELNVSAFTARCVASAGSSPYAVVMAGLAAMQGTRHGGHTGRVEALLDEAATPARAGKVLRARLARGEPIPGFGHPLYPDGDPRGKALLDLTAAAFPRSKAVALARAVEAEAQALIEDYPTIDLALVSLARAMKLPAGTALALFALGRTAGWIAHGMEQIAQGRLIRPRARYVGPLPGDSAGV